MSQKRAWEEYHDPDYPSPAAAAATEPTESGEPAAKVLVLSDTASSSSSNHTHHHHNNGHHATPSPSASSGRSRSAAERADSVRLIVRREFAHEISQREQELNRIEQRLLLAKRLLKRVRYAVVYSFYTNKKLVYTENELRNELTVVSAGGEETVVSAAATDAAHPVPAAFDQLEATQQSAPAAQLAVHPSLKKLLGTDTIDYNEILRIRPARQAAVDAKTSIAEKLRTKKDERRLRMAAAPPALLLLDTTTPVAAPKVPRYISPIKSPSAAPIRALNSARGTLRTANRTLLAVGNTSKYIGADEGSGPDAASAGGVTHKWLMYVRVKAPDEQDIGQLVAKVRFFLHPSYKPNDVVDVSRPPFQIARRGWGEFPVRVQLFFQESTQQKPMQMYHQLKLDKRLTGLQTMGSETVVEMWSNLTKPKPQPQPTEAQPSNVRHHRSPVKREQMAPPPAPPPLLPLLPVAPLATQLDVQCQPEMKLVSSILPEDIQLEETVLSSEPCWDPDGLIKSVQISAAEQTSLMAMAEESKRFAGDLSILASPPMAPRRMMSMPEVSEISERVAAMQQQILANGLSPTAILPVTPPSQQQVIVPAVATVAATVPLSRVVPLVVALPNRSTTIGQPAKAATTQFLSPKAPVTQTVPSSSKPHQLPRLPQTLMRQSSAPTTSTVQIVPTPHPKYSTPTVVPVVASTPSQPNPKLLATTLPASTSSTSDVSAPSAPSASPAAAAAAPLKPAAPLRRFVKCLDNQGKVIMVELQADPNNPKNLRMVRNNPQTGKPSVLTPTPPMPPKFVLGSKLPTGMSISSVAVASTSAVSSAQTTSDALPKLSTTPIPIASTSVAAAGPRIYVLPKGQSAQSMLQQIKLNAATAAAAPKPQTPSATAATSVGPQPSQSVRLVPNNGPSATVPAPAPNIAGLPSTKKVIMRNGQMFIIDTAQFVPRAVPTTVATTGAAATTFMPPALVTGPRSQSPAATVAKPKQQSLLKPQISLLKPQISRMPSQSTFALPSTSAVSATSAAAPLRPPQHVPLRLTPATVLRPPVAPKTATACAQPTATNGPLKFAIKLPVNSLSAGIRTTTLQPLVRKSSLIRHPPSGGAHSAAPSGGSVPMRLVMAAAPNGQPAMRPPAQLLKQPAANLQRMRGIAPTGSGSAARPPLRAILLPPEKSLFNSPAAAAAAAAQRSRAAAAATNSPARSASTGRSASVTAPQHRPTDFRRQLELRLRSRVPRLTQRAAIRYLLHTVPQVHRMAASSRDFQQAFSFVAASEQQFGGWVWPQQRSSEWRRAKCVAQLLLRVWQLMQQQQQAALDGADADDQRRWTTKEIALFGRNYGYSLPVRPAIGPPNESGGGGSEAASSSESALSTLIRQEIRRTDPALEAALARGGRMLGWLGAWYAHRCRRQRAGEVEEIVDVEMCDEVEPKQAAGASGSSRSRTGRIGKRERRPRGIFPLPEGMRREASWMAEVCRKARINIQPEEIVDDILHPSAQLVMVTALHQFASDLLHRAYASKSDEDRRSSQPADHVVNEDDLRKTIVSKAHFDFLTNRELGSKSAGDQQPTATNSLSTIKRELQ